MRHGDVKDFLFTVRLVVGRLALTQETEVRILDGEPCEKIKEVSDLNIRFNLTLIRLLDVCPTLKVGVS